MEPSIPKSGTLPTSSPMPTRIPRKKLVQKQSEEQILPCSISPAPKQRAMTALLPAPSMVATAAMMLNAIKKLAGIDDGIPVISAQILENIRDMRVRLFHDKSSLNCEEIIMALTMSKMTNPIAEMALQQLPKLRGCMAHCTAILSDRDEQVLRSMGIDVTCDPEYLTTNLYLS